MVEFENGTRGMALNLETDGSSAATDTLFLLSNSQGKNRRHNAAPSDPSPWNSSGTSIFDRHE
jgi:hypothetical protein